MVFSGDPCLSRRVESGVVVFVVLGEIHGYGLGEAKIHENEKVGMTFATE